MKNPPNPQKQALENNIIVSKQQALVIVKKALLWLEEFPEQWQIEDNARFIVNALSGTIEIGEDGQIL